MKHRGVFAPVFFALLLTSAAGCGGGSSSGPAQVQPPPPSREQMQQIQGRPNDPQSVGAAALSAPDTGTLLPLATISVRTSSITPYAVTSCSSTAACTGGTNSSTGPGVAGVSALGKGVTGTTTFNSTTSTNGQYGVYGQDSSTSGTFDAGVYGLSVRGVGVSGKSTSGYGVRGTSSGTIGVYGISSTTIGVYGSGPTRGVWGAGGPIGVYGNGTKEGVYGSSTSSGGVAVYGNSSTYIALYGTSGYIGVFGTGTQYGTYGYSSAGTGAFAGSSSSDGLYGSTQTGTGVYAYGGTGYALEAHTAGHVGAYITNTNGNGADVTGSYLGVVGRAPANGFPLVATDSSGNNLFYVTGTGDVYYHGGIHTFAGTSSGAQALAYSPQSTRPAIEDTGTARLVDGRAAVTLDSTFARTIDTQRIYQVFLTPGGDTRGLYVANKSPSQFVVREVQGGRGSFSFDYHIYAVAVGKAAERMTLVQPNARPVTAASHRPPGQVPVPKLPPQ